jgi:hypothetical protein
VKGPWTGHRLGFVTALAFVTFLFAGAPSAHADEPIAFFTSSTWEGENALDLSSLRKIYLGKRTRLFGARVTGFHMPANSPAREGFRKAVLKKSQVTLDKYWLEQALSGGYLPPREYASLTEMISAVGKKKGSIGYARLEALQPFLNSGLRILFIRMPEGDLQPADPRYPIRAAD